MKKTILLLGIYLCIAISNILAQTSQVTGLVVTAEENEPVVGASVLVVGTTIGGITDLDGKFTLNNVPSSARSLQISFIGYKTQTLRINRKGFLLKIKLGGSLQGTKRGVSPLYCHHTGSNGKIQPDFYFF